MNLEKIVGKNFQDTFETCKRSFISAFSICMTVLSNCCTLCNFDFALALAEKKNWTGSNIIFVSVNSYVYMIEELLVPWCTEDK